jgi:hypothetical protein
LAELYKGYAPSNVARDAKYSIRHDPDDRGMKVHLLYRIGHRERALLSTDLHPKLVRMVNEVKVEVQGTEGGIFYVNEWGHVLVKSTDRHCYYAGRFPDGDPPLAFMFDGREVSAAPPPGLAAGQPWPGPHAGIRYTMSADETDIYYDHEVQPRRTIRHVLTEESGRSAADVRALVRRLADHDHREGGGGRIYINEQRQFFAPRPDEEGGLEYIYLGELGDGDPWFPEPSVPF